MREARPTLSLLMITLAALTGACGKLKPAETADGAAGAGSAGADGGSVMGTAGTSGNVHVTVSGTALPHPLNSALGADEDFTMLKVAIIDPTAVILDPNAAPLGAMALNTAMTNCTTALGCAWTLPGIDITNQNLGLVGELVDARDSASRVWVQTGTGMGSKADLDAVRANPAPITGRVAFAVSRKLEAKLSTFVGTVLNQVFGAGDLEVRGFLIGHVVGKLSEGPMPAGVAGAKVSATGNFDVIYPNADFSSFGTSTAASGIFLMVPKTAAPVVTTWNVVPPAGDTRTWNAYLAGSNPGTAFVIIMPANE